MASITQDMRYRLSLIRFAEKHGVSKQLLNIRQTDSIFIVGNAATTGTIESLRDRSRRPHYHPNQHTPKKLS